MDHSGTDWVQLLGVDHMDKILHYDTQYVILYQTFSGNSTDKKHLEIK